MAFDTTNVHLLSETDLERDGNTLWLSFDLINDSNNRFISHETRNYNMDDINFRIRIVSVFIGKASSSNYSGHNQFFNLFFVKSTCCNGISAKSHYFILNSDHLQSNKRKLDMSYDNTWRLIAFSVQNETRMFSFEMEVTYEKATEEPVCNSFAPLYDDTFLTDFELCGTDGTVKVHKAVLAASSPVMKTMLEGTWKETTDGRVEISGTSRTTLQHFKDYLYLRKLPDTGVDKLLLIACYYMIPDLKQKCIKKLVSGLTAENTYTLTEFAVINSITELYAMILEHVQAGDVKVDEVRQYLGVSSINDK